MVIEVIRLPLVERPSLQDQVRGIWIGLHSLRGGAAVNISIKHRGHQTGGALEPVVRENRSRIRASNAGLPVKERASGWTRLRVILSGSSGNLP